MAITKTAVAILASTSLAAASSGTKGAPGLTSATIDCRTYYGGELTYKITNGTAPGTALNLVFQASHDGTAWSDYYAIAGDTTTFNASTLAGVNSGAVPFDRGVMYLRAIAYGNTTNAVTVEATLHAVTGL